MNAKLATPRSSADELAKRNPRRRRAVTLQRFTELERKRPACFTSLPKEKPAALPAWMNDRSLLPKKPPTKNGRPWEPSR